MIFATIIYLGTAAMVASPATAHCVLETTAMNSLARPVPFPGIAGRESSHVSAYLVSIQMDDGQQWGHICGGSILSTTKIVTAAHCVQLMQKSPDQFRVVGGKHNLWVPEKGEQYADIASLLAHPDYCSACNQTEYDVGIIELSTPFEFDEFVQRIDMIESEPKDGECVTTGWEGQTSEIQSPLSSHIVSLVPRKTCTLKYGNSTHITDLDICAGDNGKGPCRGTGRPLVCNGALAGVASWTSITKCHKSDFSTVFANVAALRDWIQGNL